MSEWWTYRPSDFLLFSPRVYERLIESHNASLGAGLWIAAALSIAVFALGSRRVGTAGRAAQALAGLGLIFAGWSFLWSRYAAINWAAGYAAPAFWAAGSGFLALALFAKAPLRPALDGAAKAALAVVGLGTLAFPLIAPATGKPWVAVELAGVSADPTALAALGLAALARGPLAAAALAVAPLLWTLYAAMTLWTLGSRPEASALLVGVALFALAVFLRGFGRRARSPQ